MQLTTGDAEKVFRKLGVTAVPSTHHVRGLLVVNGKRLLALHYSRGRKEIPPPVVHRFRRSLHMTEDEMRTFIRCSLSRDDYVTLLLAKLAKIGKPGV
jgi:hypothetical protein